MKTLIIDSEQQKTLAKSLIDEMPTDGSEQIIKKKVAIDSTAKQRGLQWRWFDEIAKSGLGADDTAIDVWIRAKWQFARPILLRDSETFGGVLSGFDIVVRDYDPEVKKRMYREFSRDYIHTEKMDRKQRAEFLTNLQQSWSKRGVNLSDPADYGVNLKYELKDKPKGE